MAQAITKNSIPTSRQALTLCFDTHLKTCQPLTFHCNSHLKEAALFEMAGFRI